MSILYDMNVYDYDGYYSVRKKLSIRVGNLILSLYLDSRWLGFLIKQNTVLLPYVVQRKNRIN